MITAALKSECDIAESARPMTRLDVRCAVAHYVRICARRMLGGQPLCTTSGDLTR